MRDSATDDAIRSIGNGFKLKMDDVGNILIKRISSRGSNSGVTIENTTEESAISNDILKLPNGMLEVDKPFKVNLNVLFFVICILPVDNSIFIWMHIYVLIFRCSI